jgi:Fe2+ transport system protein FeoA
MTSRHETERPASTHPALSDLPEGASGYVAELETRDPERLQKLMAFGVLPGMPIRLIQRRPAYVFQVGQTQVAVDGAIAADIRVRL